MIHETDLPTDAASAAPARLITSPAPQPCWMALDAAREQAFTGEIVFVADPQVRVYLDNGVAYYAERAGDPTLGSRLLHAGVVDAADLERGTVRVGGVEHLGRLFDRAPNVDRDAVMVVTEEATDAVLAELANHVIASSVATAYRHHESGVHRWFVAPPSGGSMTRPISEVAPVDNSVVEDLPGLPDAPAGAQSDELRIEWDQDLHAAAAASFAPPAVDEPTAETAPTDQPGAPSVAPDELDAPTLGYESLVVDLGALVEPLSMAPVETAPPTAEPTFTPSEPTSTPVDDAGAGALRAEPTVTFASDDDAGGVGAAGAVTADDVLDVQPTWAPADEASGDVHEVEPPPAPAEEHVVATGDSAAATEESPIVEFEALAPTEVVVPLDDEFRVVWPDGTAEVPVTAADAIAGEVLLDAVVERQDDQHDSSAVEAPDAADDASAAEHDRSATEQADTDDSAAGDPSPDASTAAPVADVALAAAPDTATLAPPSAAAEPVAAAIESAGDQSAIESAGDQPADAADGGHAAIDFEVPALVLDQLPSAESAVPDEVSDAVLRAIRAIESASAASSPVAPAPEPVQSTEPAEAEIAVPEPQVAEPQVAEPQPQVAAPEPTVDVPDAQVAAAEPIVVEPAAPAAPMGFPPPTPETSAEAIYAARTAAAEAAAAAQPAVGQEVAEQPAASPSRVASVVFVDDAEPEPDPDSGSGDRAGALRRLIGSLRRR